MQTTMQTDIQQNRKDMEQNIPRLILKGKDTKKRHMKFFDGTEPLYLKTDASGVGLGGGLLPGRDGMNYGSYDKPDNYIYKDP